jgi:hypothetical protein
MIAHIKNYSRMPIIRQGIFLLLTLICSNYLIAQVVELSARERIIKDFYEKKIEVIQNGNLSLGIIKNGELAVLKDSIMVYKTALQIKDNKYVALTLKYQQNQSKSNILFIISIIFGLSLGVLIYLKFKK